MVGGWWYDWDWNSDPFLYWRITWASPTIPSCLCPAETADIPASSLRTKTSTTPPTLSPAAVFLARENVQSKKVIWISSCDTHRITLQLQLNLAITRFDCTEDVILEQTICSGGLQIKSRPVTFKFLKDNNVPKVCDEFETEIITLDVSIAGDEEGIDDEIDSRFY